MEQYQKTSPAATSGQATPPSARELALLARRWRPFIEQLHRELGDLLTRIDHYTAEERVGTVDGPIAGLEDMPAPVIYYFGPLFDLVRDKDTAENRKWVRRYASALDDLIAWINHGPVCGRGCVITARQDSDSRDGRELRWLRQLQARAVEVAS